MKELYYIYAKDHIGVIFFSFKTKNSRNYTFSTLFCNKFSLFKLISSANKFILFNSHEIELAK